MAYTSANAGQVGPARGASLDRALRKLFPSTSKLTFNRYAQSSTHQI